jgi:hypothetical protein
MLGDGGTELQRIKDLEILFVLSMAHLRTIQHCFRLIDILDLRNWGRTTRLGSSDHERCMDLAEVDNYYDQPALCTMGKHL